MGEGVKQKRFAHIPGPRKLHLIILSSLVSPPSQCEEGIFNYFQGYRPFSFYCLVIPPIPPNFLGLGRRQACGERQSLLAFVQAFALFPYSLCLLSAAHSSLPLSSDFRHQDEGSDWDPLVCQSKIEINEWFFQTNLEAAVWYLKLRLCLTTGGKMCISCSLIDQVRA